jgi:pimeloyl-ACP methyl ester carboxylesterase
MNVRLAFIALAAVVVAATVAGSAPGAGSRSSHTCVKGPEVRFRAADHTRLVGHKFGAGKTAIVLAHGNGSDLCQWVGEARLLARHGFFVFAFDFRGHGLSQVRPFPGSERFGADVAAAVKAVRRMGKPKVHLIGSSLGGSTALVAATTIAPPVASVVSLSAPASYRRQNALAAAPRLRLPVLYVASEDEPVGIADDARALHAATASTDKRLEIVPGRSHGLRILKSVPQTRTLVESFLRAH